MHNYHLNRGTPRCAFKVDIQKAYDTVDWVFLRSILVGFGFHEKMVTWIMECVTTTSYSICVNGSLHGHFKGSRGLRQVLPFEEGKLPVKYLGVPLVSSRLKIRDCLELVDKVSLRIQDWKNKSLSMAGRQFLWCHGSSTKGKSTVAWETVCLPKREGGLGTWVWPRDLLIKHPVLSNYNLPIIDDAVDSLEWYDRNGNAKKFSVSQVWDDIRCRDNHVEWYSMVWFSACIPRHALNMWLIFRRKLRTQDLIPSWDVSTSLGNVCSLCETVMDSHEHIFFECSFSQGIWDRYKESIEDEEVYLVDGVLEGALGAHLSEEEEMEALVDAMDVDSG
ncbi:reverse transcriptase domain, reverse transcriptase zinc-binding domain protein [Tanacetum coccineum]